MADKSCSPTPVSYSSSLLPCHKLSPRELSSEQIVKLENKKIRMQTTIS